MPGTPNEGVAFRPSFASGVLARSRDETRPSPTWAGRPGSAARRAQDRGSRHPVATSYERATGPRRTNDEIRHRTRVIQQAHLIHSRRSSSTHVSSPPLSTPTTRAPVREVTRPDHPLPGALQKLGRGDVGASEAFGRNPLASSSGDVCRDCPAAPCRCATDRAP